MKTKDQQKLAADVDEQLVIVESHRLTDVSILAITDRALVVLLVKTDDDQTMVLNVGRGRKPLQLLEEAAKKLITHIN